MSNEAMTADLHKRLRFEIDSFFKEHPSYLPSCPGNTRAVSVFIGCAARELVADTEFPAVTTEKQALTGVAQIALATAITLERTSK